MTMTCPKCGETADARLIAAAPELLALVNELVVFVDPYSNFDEDLLTKAYALLARINNNG